VASGFSVDAATGAGARREVAAAAACGHPRAVRALQVLKQRSEALAAHVAREARAVLVDGPGREQRLAQAVDVAYGIHDEHARRAQFEGPPPACSPGCAFCCHVHVDATPAEVFAVAEHLRRTLTPDALDAFRVRLARHVERVAVLDHDERWSARIPCALLDAEGCCQVHPARPLRCRAFHSRSVEPCRDAFEGRSDREAPSVPALDRIHAAVEDGLERALRSAGVGASPVDLESELLRALAEAAGDP
jgi:Fe-S-cluster containining protein